MLMIKLLMDSYDEGSRSEQFQELIQPTVQQSNSEQEKLNHNVPWNMQEFSVSRS